MTYPILSIHDFGKNLLETGDLDPVYLVLNSSKLGPNTKARWCLAYWCLYHAGAASWLAERPEAASFWAGLMQAARNEEAAPTGGRWPRGKERRHWRGGQAIRSCTELHQKYQEAPEGFVSMVSARDVFGSGSLPFQHVSTRVQAHTGFGPWMSFKIADMLEQVFGVPVNFDNAAVFMFKDPTEAALRLWRRTAKLPDGARPKDMARTLSLVTAYLTYLFRDYKCASGKRVVGLPEVETILCKWKSHENGHYPVGNDLHELKEGLEPWVKCSKVAEELYEVLRGMDVTKAWKS